MGESAANLAILHPVVKIESPISWRANFVRPELGCAGNIGDIVVWSNLTNCKVNMVKDPINTALNTPCMLSWITCDDFLYFDNKDFLWQKSLTETSHCSLFKALIARVSSYKRTAIHFDYCWVFSTLMELSNLIK